MSEKFSWTSKNKRMENRRLKHKALARLETQIQNNMHLKWLQMKRNNNTNNNIKGEEERKRKKFSESANDKCRFFLSLSTSSSSQQNIDKQIFIYIIFSREKNQFSVDCEKQISLQFLLLNDFRLCRLCLPFSTKKSFLCICVCCWCLSFCFYEFEILFLFFVRSTRYYQTSHLSMHTFPRVEYFSYGLILFTQWLWARSPTRAHICFTLFRARKAQIQRLCNWSEPNKQSKPTTSKWKKKKQNDEVHRKFSLQYTANRGPGFCATSWCQVLGKFSTSAKLFRRSTTP